jgi:hypothetical protein
MRKANPHKKTAAAPELDLTIGSLLGKQSVRTTFRLPQQIIDLLSIVSNQLGLKQKSLFDQLVENRKILDQVAADAQNYQQIEEKRRPKTFVISKKSLDALDYVARERNLPRDVLVEVSINRLLPIIATEQEKQAIRKSLLTSLEAHLRQGKKILHKAGKLLGQEDQLYQRLEQLMLLSDKNVSELKEVVEKGKCMEKFE